MPDGQDGISAGSDEAPFARAAKVEYCWLKCCCPQSGHFSPLKSSERRSSFSNFVPQESHLYSKMGISYLTSTAQILSINSRRSSVSATVLLRKMENVRTFSCGPSA